MLFFTIKKWKNDLKEGETGNRKKYDWLGLFRYFYFSLTTLNE